MSAGPKKRCTMVESLEVCYRPTRIHARKIKSAADVVDIVRELKICESAQEEIHVIYLNTKNIACGIRMISRGGVSESAVDPHAVFAPAIVMNSTAMIIVHNHPSGDPEPSGQDKAMTEAMFYAGKILGIRLLDHIIIGRESFISLRERGILQ